jgi:hypothetical protein
LPDNRPYVIDTDLDKLKLALRKLDNGSAPGLSGWTGSLLRAISRNQSCLEGLACIVQDICNGVFVGATRQRLLRSRLIPIPKKSGSVRPIAIGECLYRLAALYSLSLLDLSRCCPTIQLGVGQRGGSERAVHLIRAALELHGDTAVAITTDWSNAFNARSRAQIVSAFLNSAACFSSHRLFHWAYREPSELCVFGDDGTVVERLHSAQGVRQGDPLASLAFCLSVQRIYERCAKAATSTCVAICDDFTIVGEYDNAIACFEEMKRACDEERFPLNRADGKCQMLVPAVHPFVVNSDLVELQLVKTTRLSVLGSVISFDPEVTAVRDWLDKEIVLKNEDFFQRLSTAAIPLQAALNILSTCGVPRSTYRLRTLGIRPAVKAAEEFDKLVDKCLERLLDIPLTSPAFSSVARQQLSLPLNHAGVGAKRSQLSLPSACLASRCLAIPDILGAFSALGLALPAPDHLDEVLQLLTDEMPRFTMSIREAHKRLTKSHQHHLLTDFFTAKDLRGFTEFPSHVASLFLAFQDVESVPHRLQAIFDCAPAAEEMKALCQDLPKADLARLLSAKHRLSGLAFRADIPDQRCQLSDQDFRLAIRLRLGLHLSREAESGTCPFCKDKVSLAADPGHPIDCIAFRAEHQRIRHNRLVNLIASVARQDAGCDVQAEVRISSETRHRPDLFIVTYDGRSFWSDVQVTRPDSVSNRHHAATKQCHAADDAARGKVARYAEHVAAHGGNLDILPLCFETFGAPSESAVKVFELLGKSAEAGGSASNCFSSFGHLLETAVAVCLQRGNAQVISAYLKALALRRHNSHLDAAGSLLVANSASR